MSGWGRTGRSSVRLVRTGSVDEMASAVTGSGHGGVIPRGMGRSSADAALCDGGTVLDLTPADAVLEFDIGTGLLVVEAGATLARVTAHTQPLGWMPAVLPGTGQVSVGGAIAADVHGKNHVSAGSFGHHVRWLDLLGADGAVTRLAPETHPARFWATVGGMGLTGVIVRAALQLRRGGGFVLRQRHRAGALSEMLWLMDDAVRAQRKNDGLHVVGWVDATVPGPGLGRGVVESTTLLGKAPERGFPAERSGYGFPSLPGPGIVSRPAARLAGAVRWHATRSGRASVEPVSALQPLDRAGFWPAAFGRAGLVQCQVAVPEGAESTLLRILRMLLDLGTPPVLTTLKRFGATDPAPLSFAFPGWTLAMDFPARRPEVTGALARIHRLTTEAGGRVYLAKDPAVSAPDLAAMYPRLEEWRRVRDAMDPEHRFVSDLARRTGLTTGPAGPAGPATRPRRLAGAGR